MTHQSPGQQLPSSLGWSLLRFIPIGPPPGPPGPSRLDTSPGAGADPPRPGGVRLVSQDSIGPPLLPGPSRSTCWQFRSPRGSLVASCAPKRFRQGHAVYFQSTKPCRLLGTLCAVFRLVRVRGFLYAVSLPSRHSSPVQRGYGVPPPTGPRSGSRSPDPLHWRGASAGSLSRSAGTAPRPSPPDSQQSRPPLLDPGGPEAKTGSFCRHVPRAAARAPRPLEPPARIQGPRARRRHPSAPN
ncbi:hypothetical protein NDU88_002519 [Pleurodeles waltl]|uniref:Uncharacterized protein n=1 Tax=Pleurodeles waltl TaxID=8319 RepID=A0AAV7WLG1_PLEWA|nr:hypothetical protein NDU88_002519 [Pleurodeles waltl]